MKKNQSKQTGFTSARRLCLLAGVATGALWGCADAIYDEAPTEQRQPLSDGVLDLTLSNATPASDTAFSAFVADGELLARNLAPLEAPLRSEGNRYPPKAELPTTPAPLPKLSRALEERIDRLALSRGMDEEQEVVVTFKEKKTLPRFGALTAGLARDALENVSKLRDNETLKAGIIESRRADYAALAKALWAEHGAKLVDNFWLIHGGVVRVPTSGLRSLAAREDVQYVELAQTDIPPPSTDLASVRAWLNVNWLYNNVGGYIGMLDTGVRASHERLAGRMSWVRDCVNGTSNNCGTGVGLDPSDVWNHGTSTANALSGLPLANAAHQGLTKVWLDSFKVYSPVGLNIAAAVRGFEATVAGGDYVVLAQIQSSEAENGVIATAADAAYDAGKIVVAANGNYGDAAGSVTSPARAHKVLGVGNWSQSSNALATSSGRGPTSDGRTKPDLVGLSFYTAAGSSTDTAYRIFDATSASAPTIAGALQLWRLWSGSSNPGVSYASAIAFGTNFNNPAYDNSMGAGIWRSPNIFSVVGNAVSIAQGSTVDINFPPVDGDARLQGAIWWPESVATHNDIDVQLIDPSGAIVASSATVNSVWEKVTTTWPVAGTWRLRIIGYSVTGTQTVFYAAVRVTN